MITKAGPKCDVCDHFILPGFSELHFFTISAFTNECHACDKCTAIFEAMDSLEKDWEQLPDGPIKKALAELVGGRNITIAS